MFNTILDSTKYYGTELGSSSPLTIAKYGFYGIGVFVGGRKLLQGAAAGTTLISAKITDVFMQSSKTNVWLHKKSNEYVQLAKQNLVRDLTIASAMILTGYTIAYFENETLKNAKATLNEALKNAQILQEALEKIKKLEKAVAPMEFDSETFFSAVSIVFTLLAGEGIPMYFMTPGQRVMLVLYNIFCLPAIVPGIGVGVLTRYVAKGVLEEIKKREVVDTPEGFIREVCLYGVSVVSTILAVGGMLYAGKSYTL